jgi:hypothetical protein
MAPLERVSLREKIVSRSSYRWIERQRWRVRTLRLHILQTGL